jgi:hypothetical protein
MESSLLACLTNSTFSAQIWQSNVIPYSIIDGGDSQHPRTIQLNNINVVFPAAARNGKELKDGYHKTTT